MEESKKKSKKLINLLVISSGFPEKGDKHYISIFVKQQVIALSKYYYNIYVFAPYPYNPKLISRLTGLPPSRDFQDYHSTPPTPPLNKGRGGGVHVFFPKYLDAPGRLSDSIRARRWFKMISRVVDAKKINFDVIHGHFTYPGSKVAQLLSKQYDKPYFVSVHENQNWLKRELSSPLKKRTVDIWRGASRVFFVNKIEADKLHRRYKNIEWLPNGIDTTQFRPMDKIKARRKLRLPPNKTILLSIGSLIPIKNYQLLISSIAKLAENRPDIYCVIIGSGKERSSLLRLAKYLSIQDKVMIVPQLPNDQLPAWYNACDIYCVSSRRESFGITQLEAMACGKPVVATPNGGSQVIVDASCGIISNGHDTASYTKALNSAIRKRWNTRSIINSAKRYNEVSVAKKLSDKYREAVKT